MPNWIPIVAAALAALPAAAIFFVAYGRYDGSFQDRTVFLFFIGGLLVGGFLGFLTLLIMGVAAIWQVVSLALLLPIALVATINRRRWQGERHAVFNGGAAGLGVAVMMGFSLLYFRAQQPFLRAQRAGDEAWVAGGNELPAPPLDTTPFAFDPILLGQGFLFALGLAGILFGLGLLAGDGVRRRKQFQAAFVGTAILVAPAVFLEEHFRGATWLWPILLAAYGAVFAFAAERRLLIHGVAEEARKQRRRARRKAAGP
jgi:hypothetical protein